MFVNQTHQPQVLDAEYYHSEEQFAKEKARLFLPKWHCVASRGELPRDGDYLTTSLLGYPLLLWNREGELHTFLNVCAHRSSLLTSQPCGSAERLKCQYHGWEYVTDGSTCRIPDARSFRPLAKDIASLRKFRTEVCGQLVFVTLDDSASDLPEALGPAYERVRDWFSDDWRLLLSTEQDLDVNWKLLLENVVENYHLTEVHRKSFQAMPPEEVCDHELGDDWSLFVERPDSSHSPLKPLGDFVCRVMNVESNSAIEHFHFYPHLVFARMNLFSWVQVAHPVGPVRARNWWRFFHHVGSPPSLTTRIVGRLLSLWGARFFRRVLEEDRAVLSNVQLGLQSPLQPTGGLLSTREERIVHFQEYIKRATGPSRASNVDSPPIRTSRHDELDRTTST